MVRAIVMGNRQREEEDDAGKRSQSPLVPPLDRKESTWIIIIIFLDAASVPGLLKWDTPISVRWSDM